MTTAILENVLIAQLTAGFPRSPNQLNGVRESDAELIRLPGATSILALTTDSIVEEIEAGLYDDPYLVGWMTVTACASDLAAVGADPVGILVSETLPQQVGDRYLIRLQEGIRHASAACELPVLGGDTNFSSRMQLSATALGVVPGGSPLTRLGCEPGDRLFVSGPAGVGSAFALLQLGGDTAVEGFALEYRPHARLREGRRLRGFATACIDSSDGILPALDELARLNGVGFQLDVEVEEWLHAAAARLAAAAKLPPWTMLAGPHGEFELVFTVAADRRDAFAADAVAHGWEPLEIGTVASQSGLRLAEARTRLDTGRIRNLFLEVGGDVGAYVRELLRLAVC